MSNERDFKMKYIRVILITVSVLTLVCASLTLCRVIPTFIGLVLSLSFVACDFAVQAVFAHKMKNKLSMISYIIAACVVAAVVLYNLFA